MSEDDARLLLHLGYDTPALLQRRKRHARTPDRLRCLLGYYQGIVGRAFELADEATRLRILDWARELHGRKLTRSRFLVRVLTALPYDAHCELARDVANGSCLVPSPKLEHKLPMVKPLLCVVGKAVVGM